MNKALLPMHSFLIATVAGLRSAVPADVENARFVERMTTGVRVPHDHIFEVRQAIVDKAAEIQEDGDDRYSSQTLTALQGALAGVDAQIGIYKKQFDSASGIDDATFLGDVGDVTGLDDPAPARRPIAGKRNGAAYAD